MVDDRYRIHNELVNKVLLFVHANYTGRYWSNATGAVKTESGHFQRYGLVGSADILGFSGDGKFVAIEIKTGSAVLSAQQKLFKSILIKNNGIHILVHDFIDESLFNKLESRYERDSRASCT